VKRPPSLALLTLEGSEPILPGVSVLRRPPGVWSSAEVLNAAARPCSPEAVQLRLGPCASQHNPVEVLSSVASAKDRPARHALQRHAGATFTWEAPLLCCSVLAQSGALKAESTPMRVPEPSGRIGPTCAYERFECLFLRQGPNPSIERTVTSGLRPLVTAAHVKR